MFKKRLVAVLTGLALLAGVVGSSGLAADWLGFSVTPAAHACETSGSGGGC